MQSKLVAVKGKLPFVVVLHYNQVFSKDIDLQEAPPTIISLAIKNKEKFCYIAPAPNSKVL